MIALTEKHRPKRIKDFAGLTRAKAIMGKLVAAPFESAWLFTDDSGTGKTTLALAVAAELNAQIIHIPSSECTVERVREIRWQTESMPMFGDWYLVLIDEADRMTPTAQIAFLSLLDATAFPKNTIFIFTSNSTAKLEDRFLSRVKSIEFDGQSEPRDIMKFLYTVWYAEAGYDVPMPEMLTSILPKRLADKSGNIRGFLNDMEMELMMVAA